MTLRKDFFSTKLIFCLTLATIVLSFVCQQQFGTYPKKDFDFEVYFFTAQIVHDNPKNDLYFSALDGNPQLRDAGVDSPIFQKAHQAGVNEVMLYLYPPLLADLLAHWSNHSIEAARAAWRLCNLAFLLLAIFFTARLLQIKMISPAFLILAVAFYCFFPTMETIRIGQVSLLLLCLWAASLYAYSRHLYVLSACMMGFATVLKVSPLLIVPLFVIWGNKRWLCAYLISIGSLIVAMGMFNGWHTLALATHVVGAMGAGMPRLMNKCIGAVCLWLYYGHVVKGYPTPATPLLVSTISKLVSVGFYGYVLHSVWRSRKNQKHEDRTLLFALFAVLSLLISPISWRHGYAAALLPFSLLWSKELQGARLTSRTLFLALASVSTGTLLFDVPADLPSMPHPFQIGLGAVGVVSCVALCIEVVKGYRRSTVSGSVHDASEGATV